MRTEALVERLGRDLRPVRPRSVLREAGLLLLLGVVEIAAFLSIGFMRPDISKAMEVPSFWWKLTSTGLIAVLGASIAILSIDPVRSPRRGLHQILVCIAAIFASGWIIDAAHGGLADLLIRLDWKQGLQCVGTIVALSIPPAIGIGVVIRHGAPTDRGGTALAAGLSCAAWGAFVFAFACPVDDPLFIAAWYTVACTIVTAAGRAILLRLSRW